MNTLNCSSIIVSAIRKLVWSSMIVLVFALQACSDKQGDDVSGMRDLELFSQQVRAREKPVLDRLPIMRTLEPFNYSASSIGSPFSEHNVVPVSQPSLEIDPVLPDQGRVRQIMEQFPLESLKMVGTIKGNKQLYAIVITSDESVHRVTIGDYMGTNLGEIVEVSEGEIVLEETVRAKNGQWEKRKARLALSD